MKNLSLICGLLITLCLACEREDAGALSGPAYLFLSQDGLTGALRSGDVIEVVEEELHVTNLLTGRDTSFPASGARNVVTTSSAGDLQLVNPGNARQALYPLHPAGPKLDSASLTDQPFRYDYHGKEYWASFEPAFTGFPEYARDGARDFVNRLVDWSGTAPGLEYSEYVVSRRFGQPIIVLSERQRGQYLDHQIMLVDTVTGDGFGGRIVNDPAGEVVSITFREADPIISTPSAEAFVEQVNRGYSRSYLLVDRSTPEATEPATDKRLPRRSYIDPGDLGAISASFLEDGTVMFLSDDHIVLQGSYVLDLDKGLLTVTDDTDASYRIFVDTQDGIQFTLPVSVVDLQGGRLVGDDNYLRIEVVAG